MVLILFCDLIKPVSCVRRPNVLGLSANVSVRYHPEPSGHLQSPRFLTPPALLTSGVVCCLQGVSELRIEAYSTDIADASTGQMGRVRKEAASGVRTHRIDWSTPDWEQKLRDARSKHGSQKRPQWYVPSSARVEAVTSKKAKQQLVFERQINIIRRCSIQYYFSSEQVMQLLEAVPDDHSFADNPLVGKPVGTRHVELLTTVFSRITDLEVMDFAAALGHTTYDADGYGTVDVDEIQFLRENPPPYVTFTDRIGVANIFNPLRPEGEYALNLRVLDERATAQMLVLLSTEPGANMLGETYNGSEFPLHAFEPRVDHADHCCLGSPVRGRCGLAHRSAGGRLVLLRVRHTEALCVDRTARNSCAAAAQPGEGPLALRRQAAADAA